MEYWLIYCEHEDHEPLFRLLKEKKEAVKQMAELHEIGNNWSGFEFFLNTTIRKIKLS